MPHFEYDKDYPFAAFITNLGKYNEGELVGEWVKFPTTADELKKVFERIGIGSEDDFGNPYEEWFITDYDCYVDGLYDKLGEYASLDELNYLAAKLDDMTQSEYERFQAAVEMGEHTGSIQDLINLTENLDCYDVYPDIESYEDLGRYYIDELDAMQVPEHLKYYIDYAAYGRDVAMEEGGEFTEFGYVRDTGSRFYEEYDGDRENIPEEYRIMSEALEELEPEELTEDDLYEQRITESMENAYEIDTFFRGYHAEYAVMFPDEVVQQIVLHEHLLNGDTAAIKEGLRRTAEERDITDEAASVIAALESYEQKYGIVSQEKEPLSQADRLDMATDLAFDLDEFFRQHDPQYAAQHPEPHEQKEVIADLLLEGKTAALRQQLEEMAQAGDGVLPGRIAEYERETGYDPEQDTSTLEDRALLVHPQNEEKREKAVALATEIDNAFRQHTSDYGERFPDAAEQREGIAGILLHGETSEIKNAFIHMGMEQGLKQELAPLIQNISDFEKENGIHTFSIYQLQRGPEMRDLRFEPLDRLEAAGHSVDRRNYDLIYSAPLTPGDTLETIYTEFNIDRPDNFRGHSMSMSDVVVLQEYGKETAHYCDRIGFKEVPQFLTKRKEPERDNPLRTAEMTVEDDYGMIDGVINNGRRDEPEKKASIRERLEDAKRECAERKPPEVKRPGRDAPEHGAL